VPFYGELDKSKPNGGLPGPRPLFEWELRLEEEAARRREEEERAAAAHYETLRRRSRERIAQLERGMAEHSDPLD
jgi:hypothetical protein